MTDYDPRTATGIPTEPVGSLPRPSRLQEAYAQYDAGEITREQLESEQDTAVRDSIEHLEATGAPIIWPGQGASTSRSSPTVITGSCRGSPAGRSSTRPTPRTR